MTDFDFLFDYIPKWFFFELGYKRDFYLQQIFKTLDDNTIKVISGVRRVGKSYLLKQIVAELLHQKTPLTNIFYLHLEDDRLGNIQIWELRNIFNYFLEKYYKQTKKQGKLYVFLDEIQNVKSRELFVRNLQETYANKMQIFITGSNSNLLSGELSTKLTGRYINFTIYPFSFKEFLEIQNIKIWKINPDKYTLFEEYLDFWGLPEVIKIPNQETKRNYIKTLVEAIIFKDIVQRYNIKKTEFLENLLKYTYTTTTSNLSINAILKYLKQDYKPLDYETVNSYLDYATTTFLLRNLQSIGDKTKYILKGKNKFYGIDTGIRNVFSNNFDISKKLENFVYIELLRRGNSLNFLEGTEYEIDFVANNEKIKQFFQVSTTFQNEKTFLREVHPFFQIKQQYKKTLLTLDDINYDYKWIDVRNVIDWSLE